MFTGLVEAVGAVKALRKDRAGAKLAVQIGLLAEDARLGDSIAVNGACLTVCELHGTEATFDVMAETLRVTTLGELRAGDQVNLERALSANGRFGGHFVQGHVDGVGTVDAIEPGENWHGLWIAAPAEILRYTIAKGSVAIDGVSLTVVEVQDGRFHVGLIPTTLQETNLQYRRKGDRVNLEADLIGKWINRRLDEVLGGDASSITMEKLRDQGFV